MGFEKSSFVYFLLIIDIASVIIMICFINILESRYVEYSKLFDKRNVEMRDFTIEVTNLPTEYEYGGKDILLTA